MKENSEEYIYHIARKYLSEEDILQYDGWSIYEMRKDIAGYYIGAFIEFYLSNEFIYEIPAIHKFFITDIENIRQKQLYKDNGVKLVRAIPRGHAKSTYYSRIMPIHAFLYNWSPLTVLLGNNATAAVRLIKNIRDVLETNELIKLDFGNVKGSVWQHDIIQSPKGSLIRCFGSGSGAVRGVSTATNRPSLVIGDDLDDDQSVKSNIQLQTNKQWFDSAIMSLGDQITFSTSFVMVGTLISTTSLLQHIISSPDFNSIIKQGIIQFSDNEELWLQWRDWYINESKTDRKPVSPQNDWFYTQHRYELLKGTQVLWDRPNAYYEAMLYRLSRGEKSFYSEIQNQPSLTGGTLGFIPVKVIDPTIEYETIAALDPTIKGGKLNDLSAWVECKFHRERKEVIVSFIDASQKPYGQTVDDAVKHISKQRYSALYCEANNSGEMIADAINEKLDINNVYQSMTKVYNSKPKDDRIGVLSIFANRQQLFISDDLDVEFMNEWQGYPSYRYDDVLDATATIVIELQKAGYLDI